MLNELNKSAREQREWAHLATLAVLGAEATGLPGRQKRALAIRRLRDVAPEMDSCDAEMRKIGRAFLGTLVETAVKSLNLGAAFLVEQLKKGDS